MYYLCFLSIITVGESRFIENVSAFHTFSIESLAAFRDKHLNCIESKRINEISSVILSSADIDTSTNTASFSLMHKKTIVFRLKLIQNQNSVTIFTRRSHRRNLAYFPIPIIILAFIYFSVCTMYPFPWNTSFFLFRHSLHICHSTWVKLFTVSTKNKEKKYSVLDKLMLPISKEEKKVQKKKILIRLSIPYHSNSVITVMISDHHHPNPDMIIMSLQSNSNLCGVCEHGKKENPQKSSSKKLHSLGTFTKWDYHIAKAVVHSLTLLT